MLFKNRSITTTICLVCLLAGALTTAAFGQADGQPLEGSHHPAPPPVATGALALSKTVIDTENNLLALSPSPASAFAPVTFTCPLVRTRGCTVRVEVSSQFWAIPIGTVAQVSISSTAGTVSPSTIVNVDADTTGSLASVHTFQWMITGIAAGATATVNVSFDISGGTADSGYRTETAQLFFN